MDIAGLQKLTLLDFPEKVACTVFLPGCNLRCPFCHNFSLIEQPPRIGEDELFRFLASRRGLLDGVAVTGGEPLLSPELPALLRRIRALGFAVKLDTNGCFPDGLAALLDEGLVDYVAMDIKNSPEKYAKTVGRAGVFDAVHRSAARLMRGEVAYEFRTTVVDELHEPSDFDAVGQWLAGAERFFLQCFRESDAVPDRSLHTPSREKLARCREHLLPYITNVTIRGI